jgi:hypothetical protein
MLHRPSRFLHVVLAPDSGEVRLGASLKMRYFAQQSLDVLDPDLTERPSSCARGVHIALTIIRQKDVPEPYPL